MNSVLDQRRRGPNNRGRMAISCPHEKTLFAAAVFFAALFWTGLALLLFTLLSHQFSGLSPASFVGLMTTAIIVTQATLWLRRAGQVAWLRGRAVEVGARQFPEMYAHLQSACQRLGVEPPAAYVFRRSRLGDIFHQRRRRKQVIAFSAGLFDAASDHPGTFEFFVGHALGRGIKSRWATVLFPVTVLPLLGSACGRLRIHCADRYGLAACKNPGDAVLALMLLAHRGRRWKSVHTGSLLAQDAVARQNKIGGNPCEVGNIAVLRFNFRAERYAFSCNEPLVYTVIDLGEFVPGEPSYLRAHNWKEKRLVPALTPVQAAVPEPSAERAK